VSYGYSFITFNINLCVAYGFFQTQRRVYEEQ
jgi:hypothetical protein